MPPVEIFGHGGTASPECQIQNSQHNLVRNDNNNNNLSNSLNKSQQNLANFKIRVSNVQNSSDRALIAKNQNCPTVLIQNVHRSDSPQKSPIKVSFNSINSSLMADNQMNLVGEGVKALD